MTQTINLIVDRKNNYDGTWNITFISDDPDIPGFYGASG